MSKLGRYLLSFQDIFNGKYGLLANTVSGGLLFFVGDAIEQGIEIKRGMIDKFDWHRAGRITAVAIFMGPPHHYFYKYLDKIIPRRDHKSVFKKIMADQLIACPMFSIQFFMGMAYLEGKSLPECWKEFKKKFPTVYAVDWALWPPFQLINFYLIPAGFRVLYVNTVTTFWNVFLSYMKHYDQVDPTASENEDSFAVLKAGAAKVQQIFRKKNED